MRSTHTALGKLAGKIVAIGFAALAVPNSAHAVATIAGTAISGPAVIGTAVTGTVGAATGATVAVASTDSWWSSVGASLAAASIIVIVIDPPDGTFYNGQFSIHFPKKLLEPLESGWLGDWGSNPADLAPPVDPGGGFPVDTQFVVHSPNPSLTTSTINNLATGVQSTTFDWGPSGFAVAGGGESNFYAALFSVKRRAEISYLGRSAAPMPDATLFSTNDGMSCSSGQCGSPDTQSFDVHSVPEPTTWALMISGYGCLGAVFRRRRAAIGRFLS